MKTTVDLKTLTREGALPALASILGENEPDKTTTGVEEIFDLLSAPSDDVPQTNANVSVAAPKKLGRPTIGAKAKSPAMRQSELRNRYEKEICETPSNEWTDPICRYVLNSSQKWKNEKIDEQAWQRLGQLRKFATVAK
jgi:hypothetical protein